MRVQPGVLLAASATGVQPAGAAPGRRARIESFPTLVHQAPVDAAR